MTAKYYHTFSEEQEVAVDDCTYNVVVLNMSKRIHITTDSLHGRLLMPYSVAVFKRGDHVCLNCQSETEFMVIYFRDIEDNCDRELCSYKEGPSFTEPKDCFPHMKMDEALKAFATIMIDIYQDHFEDTHFLETKLKEFFFILTKMHPIEDVYTLMSPVYESSDLVFKRRVIDNYHPSHSVKTLAMACGYSFKTFNEKFHREFEDTPGNWLKDKLSELTMSALADYNHNLSDVAESLGMSSQQQLSRYCRREFGKTPTEIIKESHEHHDTSERIIVQHP